MAAGANNNVIFNNILVSQAAAFEVQAVTGLMHDYNIVSSYTGTTASAHESTPANAAALFVNAAGGDLRLAALTPPVAVDKGIASLGGMAAPTTDVLGAPRPAGAGYDIGAYEFGSTAPPTGTGGAAGSGGARRHVADRAAPAAAIGGSGNGGNGGSGGNVGSTGGTGATAGSPATPPGATSGGCGCRAAGAGGALAGCLACNLLAVPGSILVLSRRRRGARRSS